MDKEKIHEIARRWANGELPLYEALYAAYALGRSESADG